MENLKQFEALFNHATIGIVLCNEKAEIVNFNSQAETHFGYKKEEVLGKKIEVLLPQKYRQSHVKDRTAFYANPTNKIMGHGRDLHGQKKDGSEFPVEVSLSNYQFKGETYVIAFVIDITVRKNNEIAVLKQREELEQITKQVRQLNADLEVKVENRTKMLRETLVELEKSKKEVTDALAKEKELGDLKSGFVTMASHEFRTPLSTIMTSAFLLSKYNGADEGPLREKHISRIQDAVNAMKNILEDFLSLGKLEEGSVSANNQWLTAREYVPELQNAVDAMTQLAKKGQQLVFTHTGDASLYTDLMLIKNILFNLISNAIKFSPEKSKIEVISYTDAEGMELRIKDHGIGISTEDKAHLFERFFRAKNAANIQGTGLGLHIVAKYLELLGGRIELHSELNIGTEFIIYIPQSPNEKDPAD